MMQRVFNWFSTLGAREKILVSFGAAAALFAASFFVTLGLLSSRSGEDRSAPSAQATAPGVTYPEDTLDDPGNIDVKITRAQWSGERVEVEGRWTGEISSVHCDLFEGSASEPRVTDWWDREVPPSMSLSERTFTQIFVEAEGREIQDPVEPTTRYSVICSGSFEGGWSVNAAAPVE